MKIVRWNDDPEHWMNSVLPIVGIGTAFAAPFVMIFALNVIVVSGGLR